MKARSLLAFEGKRAVASVASPAGLASLVVGIAFMCGLIAFGYGRGRTTTGVALMLVLGAAWSAVAAVYTIDRNKGKMLEDVWFGWCPGTRRQILVVYAAWLPVALLQGFLVALGVVAARGEVLLADLRWFPAGFLLGIPAGLALAALARVVPSVSVVAGLVMFGTLFAINLVAGALPGGSPLNVAADLAAYAAAAGLLFVVVARGTGRSR